jgi:hypothetical protein
MRRVHLRIGVRLLAVLCALPLSSALAAAQTAPPIDGVNGTTVPESTVRSEYGAAHAVAEGAKHVVDRAKKLLSFGGKGTDQNPLDGFIEGRRVVVRDIEDGDGDAPKTTEGVVIDVNRRRRQITVRLSDRKTQTLRLAAPDAAPDVVVTYTDDAGAKIAHDFNRVS